MKNAAVSLDLYGGADFFFFLVSSFYDWCRQRRKKV